MQRRVRLGDRPPKIGDFFNRYLRGRKSGFLSSGGEQTEER